MNILHISDVHFCISYREIRNGYEKMLHKMQSPEIPLKFCLRRALEKYPAELLVITGDLTDEGTAEDYRRLKNIIRGIIGEELPVLVTPGNHDILENFRTGWLERPSSSEVYNDVFENEELAVLSFDSSEHGNSDGIIRPEQVKWLERELKDRQDKPVVLMTHHHLDPGQADISPVKYGEDFLELLRKYSPVCILNGHTHHNARGRIAGVSYFTADGMSFCGDGLEDGRVRFREKYGYSWYHIEGRTIKETASETFDEGRVLEDVRWE